MAQRGGSSPLIGTPEVTVGTIGGLCGQIYACPTDGKSQMDEEACIPRLS